ncbi:Rrf2 family transcriptional regulator [Lentzea californiensis]|uniref:Rrf2 family transcriptional regulator n=1 Tax=Lentzea californiensis TaxID=438851 RepID=UPI00216520EB|nr:Rrf2 family transcriptional regulator [Lentzea californiensis]MCR3753961.1 Transcriptional regulator [Lentzea californiensis]
MNQGVEWTVHVLLSLAWVDDGRPVSTAALAASYDLPQAHLHKQLQALARAGSQIRIPGFANAVEQSFANVADFLFHIPEVHMLEHLRESSENC